jgi:anti-sigma regulatory factor (Ser/Thr protein kinase)
MPRARWSALASAENVPQIRQAVVDFACANGVSGPLVADIQIAVSEAVTNAVMHAYHRFEQPGGVEVHAAVANGWFEARVLDDGAGPAPRDDSPGVGLGLPLIHRLADQVELQPRANGGGTEVRMRFSLRDAAHAPRS